MIPLLTGAAAAAAPTAGSFMSSIGGAALIDTLGNLFGSAISGFSNPYKKAYKYWDKAKKSNIADVKSNLLPGTPYYNMASNNMQGYNELLGKIIADKIAFMSGGGETLPAVAPKKVNQSLGQAPEVSYPWLRNTSLGSRQ